MGHDCFLFVNTCNFLTHVTSTDCQLILNIYFAYNTLLIKHYNKVIINIITYSRAACNAIVLLVIQMLFQ